MIEKTIISGKGSASVTARGPLVLLTILTKDGDAYIQLSEDQARELGDTLKAFAFIVSSQESDKS